MQLQSSTGKKHGKRELVSEYVRVKVNYHFLLSSDGVGNTKPKSDERKFAGVYMMSALPTPSKLTRVGMVRSFQQKPSKLAGGRGAGEFPFTYQGLVLTQYLEFRLLALQLYQCGMIQNR
ncbi:hypothetical protein [Methylomonas sp. Kb3]|uniref:hypothetical protein n=1 Tax=Methylomonas sp. Kb3 TaxID=1611544 RepID=UPI001056CB70|nr:hypothetical protein [Methylomonas sp. Kb3]